MSDQPEFVVCIDNSEYAASLEIRKIYQTLPDPKADQLGHVRVIDESGEDYVYPASRFLPIQLSKDLVVAITQAA